MGSDGATLAAAVSFRIGGKFTTAQIVPFLNSGLSLIEAAGSFSWDTTLVVAAATNAQGRWPIPADMDVGREATFSNVNHTPIVKATVGEILWMSSNYKNIGTGSYNQWLFLNDAGTQYVQFVPQVVGVINGIYHKLAPVLLTAGGPSTPWTEQWLDSLVVDYAEAEIKRVLDWVGWQELSQRFVARLMDVTKIFSNQRENTGPGQEVAAALGEKASGRV